MRSGPQNDNDRVGAPFVMEERREVPHWAVDAVEKHIKRQPTFQAVSTSRDVFLHTYTAYVFSNVYRVFTKSSPLGGGCN